MTLLYPALLLMLHTLLVGAYMGYRRYTAVTRREVSPNFYRAYIGEEPEHLRVLSRHMINLLEAPVLFYVLTLIAVFAQLTSPALLILAWSYVILRFIHSAIHLGPNIVIWRFRVFVLSFVVLAVYLVMIGTRLL